MKQAPLIAAATVVLALAGPALAFGPGGGGKHGPKVDFETLDADGNGEVTKAELQALDQARFATVDSDGDGKLSRDEMIAEAQRRAEDRVSDMIERFDKDADGALSLAEMPKPRRRGSGDRIFDMMDADDSGGVTREEFEEARAWMKERRGGKRHGHGKPWRD